MFLQQYDGGWGRVTPILVVRVPRTGPCSLEGERCFIAVAARDYGEGCAGGVRADGAR